MRRRLTPKDPSTGLTDSFNDFHVVDVVPRRVLLGALLVRSAVSRHARPFVVRNWSGRQDRTSILDGDHRTDEARAN